MKFKESDNFRLMTEDVRVQSSKLGYFKRNNERARFSPFLITFSDGLRVVILSESETGAKEQAECRSDVLSVEPIPFMVRGYSEVVFSCPSTEEKRIKLNDTYDAVVSPGDTGLKVKVGCQEFTAEKIKELAKAIEEMEKAQ